MEKRVVKSILFILLILAALPIFGQKVNDQQKKPLSLNDILSKLTFTSRISKTNEQINKQLISDIRKRGVNFLLSDDDKKAVKEARGTDLLIKAIDENLREEIMDKKLKDKMILYKNFVDNYEGDYKQKKIALKAAQEYLEKYGEDNIEIEDKFLIEYFKTIIPQLIEELTPQTKIQDINNNFINNLTIVQQFITSHQDN